MMYWKDGFYDEPINGSVEVTEEYYRELLDGQSSGLLIIEDENGYPMLKEYEATIEELRAQKIAEIWAYDTSEAVNRFSINGIPGWLDKSTRVGLMNSILIEREAGRTNTSIWLGNNFFILSIENAINMLQQIELYALACYHVTQGHIRAINEFETKEEIKTYNFTTGYPEKLSFEG